MKNKQTKPRNVILSTIVVFGWIILIVALIGNCISDCDYEAPDQHKLTAWTYAQDVVRSKLRSPGTADFGWQTSDECVEAGEDDVYTVTGWVDAQNGFGATIRAWFCFDVKRNKDGKWTTLQDPILITR